MANPNTQNLLTDWRTYFQLRNSANAFEGDIATEAFIRIYFVTIQVL